MHPCGFHLAVQTRNCVPSCCSHLALNCGTRHGCFGSKRLLLLLPVFPACRMGFQPFLSPIRTIPTTGRRVLRRFEHDEISSSEKIEEEQQEEERFTFDTNLAVVLAGFAFESYNTPSTNVGVRELDGFDCETVFLSERFLHDVYDGQIFIELKRGRQFPGMDLWGTSDPYVMLRIGDCVVRSRTIWATKDPVWNERFSINVKNPTSQYLQIAGWDANIVASHRRMGNAGVNLESLCDGERHEVCVELEGMGGGGNLNLEVQYKTFCQIDAEKLRQKIPFLSDFLAGGGLDAALKTVFGIEGIKARDFVRSAIGSPQPAGGKDEMEDGNDSSQIMDSSEISESMHRSIGGEGIEIQTGRKNDSIEVEEQLKFSRDAIDGTKHGLERRDEECLETKEQADSLGKHGVMQDFFESLYADINKSLGDVSVDNISFHLFNHIKWDANDLIKRLGLEAQNKAETHYVENGLALPRVDSLEGEVSPKADSSKRESLPASNSIPLDVDVKKASMDLLRQTEEILGSWAVLAASLTGWTGKTNQGRGKEGGGKTTAIVTETQPASAKDRGSEWGQLSVGKHVSEEEMEDLRTMFKTAESAMEAWAMLATSVGRSSFVKSEFEKICFLENNRTDTQVCIWRDARHHRLVVAFRGTEQVKWKDLITDLMLLPAGFNPERVAGNFREEVMVHSGFLSAYDSVKNRLMSLVRTSVQFSEDQLSTNPNWHIYSTGHSLGGALATLFALDLSSSKLSKGGHIKVTMYNFGSPRVGNKKFAELYNEKVKDSWRVVNHRDIIPTVPRLMGYFHVAQPIYLSSGDLSGATVKMELLEDGYQGDVIGEATPDFLVHEFMKGEKDLIERLLHTEITMLRALRDGSALMQHMEDFYYIALLERVSPSRVVGATDREVLQAQSSKD